MSLVFLSYKSEDRAIAEGLGAALNDRGFSVWYDRGLAGDTPFHEQISEQLRLATIVVAIWSARSADSRWVYSEADEADKERKLINLRIDNALPPKPFDRLHAHDFSGWSGDPLDNRVDDLVRDMRKIEARLSGGGEEPRTMPRDTAAARAWMLVQDSIDVEQYRNFVATYSDSPQASLAIDHINDLQAWAQIDRTVPKAIDDFVLSGPFPALGNEAKRVSASLRSRLAEQDERSAIAAERERRARDATEREQQVIEQAQAERRRLRPAAREAHLADAAKKFSFPAGSWLLNWLGFWLLVAAGLASNLFSSASIYLLWGAVFAFALSAWIYYSAKQAALQRIASDFDDTWPEDG